MSVATLKTVTGAGEKPTEIRLDWTIHNFSFLKDRKEYMYSDELLVDGNVGRWGLQLSPLVLCDDEKSKNEKDEKVLKDEKDKKAKKDEKKYVGLYVRYARTDGGDSEMQVQAKLSVIQPTKFSFGDVELHSWSFSILYDHTEKSPTEWTSWGSPKYLPHDKLFAAKPLLSGTGDKLILRVEVEYMYTNGGPGHSSNPSSPTTELAMVETLQNDYKTLLESAVNSDFTLVTSDGSERKVHQAILAARSDFFKNLFITGEYEEVEAKRYSMAVSAAVLDCVLKYLYYGIMEGNGAACLEDLMLAAEKYQMEDLKLAAEARSKSLKTAVEKEKNPKTEPVSGKRGVARKGCFKKLKDALNSIARVNVSSNQ